MRRLDARTFTEIALSMVPLSNAPTWVKALWIEQELAAKGLWRDDVFELIRPFLVSGRSEPADKKAGQREAPKPLLKPAGPRPEFVVSQPLQTAEEAKWAPSYDDPITPISHPDSTKTAAAPAGQARKPGYRLKQPLDTAESGGSLFKEYDAQPADDYDAEADRWQPPRASTLHYDELTPDEAELASMMHLLAVSARLSEEPTEIEPSQAEDAGQANDSSPAGDPLADGETGQVSRADVAADASTGQQDQAEAAPEVGQPEIEPEAAGHRDEPVQEEIAVEWMLTPEPEPIEEPVTETVAGLVAEPAVATDPETGSAGDSLPFVQTAQIPPVVSEPPKLSTNSDEPALPESSVTHSPPDGEVADLSGASSPGPVPETTLSDRRQERRLKKAQLRASLKVDRRDGVQSDIQRELPKKAKSEIKRERLQSEESGKKRSAARKPDPQSVEPVKVEPARQEAKEDEAAVILSPVARTLPELGGADRAGASSSEMTLAGGRQNKRRSARVSAKALAGREQLVSAQPIVQQAGRDEPKAVSGAEQVESDAAEPARRTSSASMPRPAEAASELVQPATAMSPAATREKTVAAAPGRRPLKKTQPGKSTSTAARHSEDRTDSTDPVNVDSYDVVQRPQTRPQPAVTGQETPAKTVAEPKSASQTTQPPEAEATKQRRRRKTNKTESEHPAASAGQTSHLQKRSQPAQAVQPKKAAAVAPERNPAKPVKSVQRTGGTASKRDPQGRASQVANTSAAQSTPRGKTASKLHASVSPSPVAELPNVVNGTPVLSSTHRTRPRPVAVPPSAGPKASARAPRARKSPASQEPAKPNTSPSLKRGLKRGPKRVPRSRPRLRGASSSDRAPDRDQQLQHLADAAAIADLYGIHIDTTSSADQARLLFFASALKTSDGDWAAGEEQLTAALQAASQSRHPELWKQVIEQSLKIHRRLDRPAA